MEVILLDDRRKLKAITPKASNDNVRAWGWCLAFGVSAAFWLIVGVAIYAIVH